MSPLPAVINHMSEDNEDGTSLTVIRVYCWEWVFA